MTSAHQTGLNQIVTGANAPKGCGLGARWAAYAVIFALTAGLMTAAVCRVRPLLSANDRSRWCTVWSLVERGTYRIDEIDAVPGWGTIDKVRHEEHFYSSKPPLLATMVAGAYWIVRGTTGWTLDDASSESTADAARSVLLLVNVVPLLIAIGLMAGLADRFARTDFTRIFVVGSFALATFLTTFSVTLNNHTVAALALVVSIWAAAKILADGLRSPWYLALAGFFASFAAANELPAAAFAATLFLWMLWRTPAATMKWFFPAALLPVAAFVLTTYFATGDWKPFYAYYGTEKYRYVVDGVPSYWLRPAGLDVNAESPIVYFLNCTIGHHGIFSLSPIFLLALASWVVPRLSHGTALRSWLWLSAGLTVIVLGFYLTRTQNYNYGGNCAGLRWAFWLIPLWILSMIPLLDAIQGRPFLKGIACALLAVTTFSSWYPIENPWQHPWLLVLMERWGWVDYKHPPEPFNRPVTTLFPLLPDDEAAHEWIEFEAREPNGNTTRLRLSDQGTVSEQGVRLRKIVVTWKGTATAERTTTLWIEPDLFAAGEPPAKFLRWPTKPPDAAAREAVERFVRGLPTPHGYHRGTIRYLKTPLRHDAFECRRAAAQVEKENDIYRADVWLTPEVPFGLLQFEQTVRDEETGDLLTGQRFVAVASSRSYPQQNSPKHGETKSRQRSSTLNIPD